LRADIKKKIGLPVFWPTSRFLRRIDEKIIRLSVIKHCKFPAKHKKIDRFFYPSNFKLLTWGHFPPSHLLAKQDQACFHLETAGFPSGNHSHVN